MPTGNTRFWLLHFLSHPAAELTHATFSGFKETLRDAGPIAKDVTPANPKGKACRITNPGEIAFRFFSDPATNTLVRTIPEKG